MQTSLNCTIKHYTAESEINEGFIITAVTIKVECEMNKKVSIAALQFTVDLLKLHQLSFYACLFSVEHYNQLHTFLLSL